VTKHTFDLQRQLRRRLACRVTGCGVLFFVLLLLLTASLDLMYGEPGLPTVERAQAALSRHTLVLAGVVCLLPILLRDLVRVGSKAVDPYDRFCDAIDKALEHGTPVRIPPEHRRDWDDLAIRLQRLSERHSEQISEQYSEQLSERTDPQTRRELQSTAEVGNPTDDASTQPSGAPRAGCVVHEFDEAAAV
jgi:hypothetical protein